jgi:hypothetical protein
MNRLACLAAAGAMLALQTTPASTPAWASDHADPIDNPLRFWRTTPLEGGITDLFVFPAKNGTQMVVVLCVRRSLTGKPAKLDQYEYVVRMDLKSTVSHDDPHNNARYGGTVVTPENIRETTTITYRLKGDGEIREDPIITIENAPVPPGDIQVWGGENVLEPRKLVAVRAGNDAKNEYSADATLDETKVNVWTGISDDPFIFPNFFRTNVVAMVATIPMKYFPASQTNWIIWATSSKGGKQIDHVGRSLRTQNPRFELLNTLHPSKHVEAIRAEHEKPSIMRDIFLRLGINQLFGFRSWDFVPDVMLFTRQPGIQFGEFEARGADGKWSIVANTSDGQASFPNGRFLSDDVAIRLGRYGDTALLELSHLVPPCQDSSPPSRPECRRSSWPRLTVNDRLFQGQQSSDQLLFEGRFPYLAQPWTGAEARLSAPRPALRMSTVMTIALVLLGVVLLWIGTAWLLALWIDRKRLRRRYL